VIADAQLAASSAPDKGGSVVAFMNAGGIRNGGLTYANQAGAEAPGQVTYGELFTVQPFNNVLTVVSCTGKQIDDLLEQQFTGGNGILQVSKGFSYTYDVTRPAGSRIDPSTIKINGTTLDPGTSYRVTTNNFLVTGGDGYSVFTQCTSPLGGDIDLDALVAYFEANSPVAPGPRDRITRIG
jgi:5'-nucleotidase